MKKNEARKSTALVKSNGIGVEKSYAAWIADLKRRYRATQIKAAVAVNSAMLEFYWTLGMDISSKYPGKKRNIGFFDNLSNDLCLGIRILLVCLLQIFVTLSGSLNSILIFKNLLKITALQI